MFKDVAIRKHARWSCSKDKRYNPLESLVFNTKAHKFINISIAKVYSDSDYPQEVESEN